MAWYVAKIVGKHPKWGFDRQFRRDIDPEDPQFPEDGLWEVQTRTRTYYYVEDGEVKEITLNEAKEIVEKMAKEQGTQKTMLPVEWAEAIRKNRQKMKDLWEIVKKDSLKGAEYMNWEAWKELATIIKDWAEDYKYSEDSRDLAIYSMLMWIWEGVVTMREMMAYAGDKSGMLREYVNLWRVAWEELLRYHMAVIQHLPDELKQMAVDDLEKTLKSCAEATQ